MISVKIAQNYKEFHLNRVYQRSIKTIFTTNLCIGLKDGQKLVKQRSFIKRVNIGNRKNLR